MDKIVCKYLNHLRIYKCYQTSDTPSSTEEDLDFTPTAGTIQPIKNLHLQGRIRICYYCPCQTYAEIADEATVQSATTTTAESTNSSTPPC